MAVEETVGGRVRAARKRLDWSRDQLAKVAGINLSTLDAIERDRVKSPGVLVMKRVAWALGAPLDELVPDEEPEELPRPGQKLRRRGTPISVAHGDVTRPYSDLLTAA